MSRANRRVEAVVAAPGATWRYRNTCLLSPFFEGTADAVCRGTAKRDLARMALAVERFRRARGRLPRALDELVPDFTGRLPSDPFSGMPISWRVMDQECRIYSIGPDGTDQGGEERPGVADDIVFHLWPRNGAEGTRVED